MQGEQPMWSACAPHSDSRNEGPLDRHGDRPPSKPACLIGQSSPEYAQSVVDRLTRRSQQIGNFPESGRIVPEAERPQIREVLEGPYRIMYHIKPDQVDVIAVIHGSQQTPWT